MLKRFVRDMGKSLLHIVYIVLATVYLLLGIAGVVFAVAGLATAAFTWLLNGALLLLVAGASGAVADEIERRYDFY